MKAKYFIGHIVADSVKYQQASFKVTTLQQMRASCTRATRISIRTAEWQRLLFIYFSQHLSGFKMQAFSCILNYRLFFRLHHFPPIDAAVKCFKKHLNWPKL